MSKEIIGYQARAAAGAHELGLFIRLSTIAAAVNDHFTQ